MSTLNSEEIVNRVLQNFLDDEITYKQYLHKGICKDGHYEYDDKTDDHLCCKPYIWQVYASDNLQEVPKHPRCDCFYKDLDVKPIGSISERQPAPDVWLNLFGKLPDYYIEYNEAKKLGWRKGKDLSIYAPNKMIGGDIYNNYEQFLPEKNGRIWRHCDVDYTNGDRNNQRLYYSNDGLIFYSPSHLDKPVEIYWIK